MNMARFLSEFGAFPQWYGTTPQCPHCHCYHAGVCYRIKAIEYYQDGTVKRVEYHPDRPVVDSVPLRHPVDESKVF